MFKKLFKSVNNIIISWPIASFKNGEINDEI